MMGELVHHEGAHSLHMVWVIFEHGALIEEAAGW